MVADAPTNPLPRPQHVALMGVTGVYKKDYLGVELDVNDKGEC